MSIKPSAILRRPLTGHEDREICTGTHIFCESSEYLTERARTTPPATTVFRRSQSQLKSLEDSWCE